jgi:hypothetical protein
MRVIALTVTCLLLGAVGADAATFTLSSGTGLSITAGAPTQTGRTTLNGTSSTCASPKVAPGRTSTGTNYAYASTSVNNLTDAAVCLTYTVTPSCSPTAALFVTAYNGSFSAADPSVDYLADPGVSITSATSFSANLPAMGYGPLVIATSGTCSSFSYSIAAPRPVAVSAPTIPTVVAVGVPVTATPGYWPGSGAPSYAYQWQRCDATGSGCANVGGATTDTYTPTPDDEGHTFKVRVTDTDTATSGRAFSVASNVVSGNLPAPKITAKTSAGHELVSAPSMLTGSQADDAVVDVALPFPVTLSGVSRAHAFASTNGNLQFVDSAGAASTAFSNQCLPAPAISRMLAPYWDDLTTSASVDPSLGIFTATAGAAPHRTFIVEWRAAKLSDTSARVDFETLIHEDTSTVSFVYGDMSVSGSSATIGYQGVQAPAYTTQSGCNQDGIVSKGTQIDYTASAPSVAGLAQAGQTLTGSDAEYVSGRTPLTSATSWESCAQDGSDCRPLQAGGGTFALTSAQVGRVMRLSSTATGPEGTTTTISALTAPVAGAPGTATPTPTPTPTVSPIRAVLKLTSVKLSTSKLDRHGKATVSVTGSASGRLKIVLARKTTGRKSGKRCVAKTNKNARAKHCTRYVTARTLTAALTTGKTVKLTVKGKDLKRGSYRLTATLTSGGATSPVVQKSLTVR